MINEYKVYRYEEYNIILLLLIWVTIHHQSTVFKTKCTYATVMRPLLSRWS